MEQPDVVAVDVKTAIQPTNKKRGDFGLLFFYFPLLPLLFIIGLNAADVAFVFEFSFNGVESLSSLGF